MARKKNSVTTESQILCRMCEVWLVGQVIQKGLERIFKEAYKLQPHHDDKVVFISHNPKEAEKMRSMGVYRFSDNFQAHFRRWYPTINKRRKRLTHKGGGVGIVGYHFLCGRRMF